VLGPDVAAIHENDTLFGPFLDEFGPSDEGSPDVATWHFYYGPGSTHMHALSWQNFSQTYVLDKFIHKATKAREQAARWLAGPPAKGQPQRQLWLGETSSTYAGGSGYDSSSFVAGFLWLDKLGIAANLGNSVVLRQTYVGNNYSLLGSDDLPNPDYYSSVLWRHLVGAKVLRVKDGLACGRRVRAYAFCARGRPGGVALVLLNTRGWKAKLAILGLRGMREVYLLTAREPASREVFLNGAASPLAVDPSTGALPRMEPRRLAEADSLTLPPRSYGFVVLPNAGASACNSQT